ncbi:unnamed protein product, partial [Scytosiphon promiscuus]
IRVYRRSKYYSKPTVRLVSSSALVLSPYNLCFLLSQTYLILLSCTHPSYACKDAVLVAYTRCPPPVDRPFSRFACPFASNPTNDQVTGRTMQMQGRPAENRY